jgi:mRNA-degrading endonuclease RelE of RelBE toxin-antitoxin system
MRREVLFAPEAVQDLKRLDASARVAVLDAIEKYLRYEPARTSRTRIKRLRGLARPQFRLRVGEVRVFHDVSASRVEVLAVVRKADADAWLEEAGERM